MSISGEKAEALAREWIKLEQDLSEIKSGMKEMNQRKKEIHDALERYLQQRGRTEENIDGVMTLKMVTKKVSSNSKKTMIETLKSKGNITHEKATGIINLIHGNRPFTEKTQLKIQPFDAPAPAVDLSGL